MFDTTIIIPTRNRLSMLLRAVESIAIQTLQPMQIIIIDDCSEKEVRVEDFIKYPNLEIVVINNKKTFGGAYSRNRGIKLSETKYITFLDDDDTFSGNYLEEINRKLNETKLENIALYSSKKFVLSSSLGIVFKESIVENIVKTENLLLDNIIGTTSCVTVTKQALEDINYFDESLPAFQDYDCWLRLSLDKIEFYPVPNAFVYYTINTSSKQISGNFHNHIKSREIILNKFMDKISYQFYNQLKVTLSFFTAKSIHRKNYFLSLKYTIPIIFKNRKSMGLLIPYKILNKFGIYTS